jgi:HEPN domain-containing protein
MYLGIAESTELVFEGNGTYGARVVWPSPLLMPANFSSITEPKIFPAMIESSGISTYLFREDSFDPVTKIRRGRFYKKSPSQPGNWTVMVAPPLAANAIVQEQRAYTFLSCSPSDIPITPSSVQHLVTLGAEDTFSVWMILSKELVHTKEIVVTLKARQSFGALPEIDWGRLPDKSGLVKEKLESLLDDIYRAGAESIVDRAREAATAILSAYLQSEGISEAGGKDLGALTDLLDKRNGRNGQRIVRCAAEIPQRLHSRGKHAEQEKRDDLRPIREQDAELAVQCIGVMLCDFGWARWS